ncbi:MAG: anthranilate phosphoribosyltransferase [Calditrichia bacterium]|nr:anthranilate phosphoribosyltransferase [Calditrichia bacterium]
MIKEHLEKIIAGEDLTFDESHKVLLCIMSGEVNHSQIAALLTALKIKGETHEEVAGFVSAMREKSIKIKPKNNQVIDVCGTGGDFSGTFNISTAAAFVVAGAGITVAKHGNRSISSKSGSADVLKELGVNINLSPDQSEKALEEIGITFLFAPDYHPAMKYVAPVRQELGMKTVFNILGPLTNPAGTKKQLIGTFNNQTAKLMARAADFLQMEKVLFVCTDNRYDEVLLSGETLVYEYQATKEVTTFTLTNKSFDYPEIELKDIKGDSAEQNAKILRHIFTSQEKTPAFYVTAANAALALYAADYSSDLKICIQAAEDAIISGKAQEKLEQFVEFGRQV